MERRYESRCHHPHDDQQGSRRISPTGCGRVLYFWLSHRLPWKVVKRGRRINPFAEDDLVELFADEPELLAISDALAQTQATRSAHRTRVLVACVVAVAILLVAVPALALTGAVSVTSWFAKAPAPGAAVKQFQDLRRQAPPSHGPALVANEARILQVLPLPEGGRLSLYVAPTRRSGYCFQIGRLVLGCNPNRTILFQAGFALTGIAGHGIVYGSTLDGSAATVEIRGVDGRREELRLTRVSSPIDASFFMVSLNNIRARLPITVTLRDSMGRMLSMRTLKAAPGTRPGN